MATREQAFPGAARLTLLVLACAVVITVALAVRHADQLVSNGPVLDGVPAVGNNDGYFHLDRAAGIAGEGRGLADVLTDPRPSMLLPYALASAAGTKAAVRHRVAALAGPVLGLSMVLAVLPWTLACRSRFTLAAAPLLALLSPYWLARTHVGFLDTDSLAPMLCSLALFCLYRFAANPGRRMVWGVLYCLIVAVSWYWWRPGAYLCAGFLACYLIYPAWSRTDVLIKCAILVAILGGVGLAALGIRPFSLYAAYVARHLDLAFGGEAHDLLSGAIRELGGVTPAELGRKSLGSPWLLAPALLGALAYGIRLRSRALFLTALCALGAASLVSRRFIPLFVPAGALLAAYGVAVAVDWLARAIPFPVGRERARVGLFVVGAVLLFAGAGTNAATQEPRSYFSRGDLALADTIKRTMTPDTVLWTWWDYGYFFQYLTGMKTFFDGGSQTLATCFTVARPLMSDDQAGAAAWMHHFAAVRPRLDTTNRGEAWAGYVASLEASFAEQGQEVPVALVLPARVYSTVGYLYAFAHVFDPDPAEVVNRLELFSREGFAYDEGAQTVTVPEAMAERGYGSVGAVLDATGKVPEDVDFTALADPYLVFSRDAAFLAVTDRAVVRSVLFRLLGLFEYDRRRFEPVFFEYRTGGVWRVR